MSPQLQGKKISQARSQHETGNKVALLATCLLLVSCLAYSLTLKMRVTLQNVG
jgi:hypothetical protein